MINLLSYQFLNFVSLRYDGHPKTSSPLARKSPLLNRSTSPPTSLMQLVPQCAWSSCTSQHRLRKPLPVRFPGDVNFNNKCRSRFAKLPFHHDKKLFRRPMTMPCRSTGTLESCAITGQS